MENLLKLIRLIKKKVLIKILPYIKNGFGSLETLRDLSLGLLINGIYGIFNEPNFVSLAFAIVSFLAIIIINNELRRHK